MSTIDKTNITTQDVVYPDSDGLPMADNTLQFRWIVTIKEGLEALFRQRNDVFVAGDLLWYPVQGDPKVRRAPDALVAFGRPKRERRSYIQHEEAGVAPQVVFEVLSPNNTPQEMREKRLFYQTYGVEEYYQYDPDSGELLGWIRVDDTLEPIAVMRGWVSPRLDVTFDLEGVDLVMTRPDGQRFLSVQQIDQERIQQFERAERERQRADEATQRAELLAEKLRAFGIDPEEP